MRFRESIDPFPKQRIKGLICLNCAESALRRNDAARIGNIMAGLVTKWEWRKLASELAFWYRRVPPDTTSASPQGKAISEIVGIMASEPSGSRALFLHAYLGKRPNYSRLPLLSGTAEHLAARE